MKRKIIITEAQANLIKSRLTKKKFKITSEQFDRLFGKQQIAEDASAVDANFKKALTHEPSRHFKSTKDTHGTKFKINEGVDVALPDFAKETIELLKEILTNPEQAGTSEFWGKLGIDKSSLFDLMVEMGLLVGPTNGTYKVVKANFGQNIKNLYKKLFTKVAEPEVAPQETAKAGLEEVDNLPTGAENDSNAPWNDTTKTTTPKDPKYKPLDFVAMNKEIVLFKDDAHKLFIFYYYDTPKKAFQDYAEVPYQMTGKDEDGDPIFDYEEFEVDGDVITRYVNDNLGHMSKGKGIAGWESGKDLVLVDDELKAEMLSLYSKDKTMTKAFGAIDEVAGDNTSIKQHLATQIQQKPEVAPSKEDIESVIARKRQAELDRRKAAGETQSESEVVEATTTGSVGGANGFAYDVNAFASTELAGNGKKGETHHKTMIPSGTMVGEGEASKGGFVKLDDCVKLDNNKEAEKGGCSVGATDKVAKTTKTAEELYEEVAKKTGRTIEEVKNILSKNIK